MITRVLSFILILVLAFASLSCTAIDSAIGGVTNALGVADTATVIAKTVQIRTSYSVTTAELLEIKRGDTTYVLDSFEFE